MLKKLKFHRCNQKMAINWLSHLQFYNVEIPSFFKMEKEKENRYFIVEKSVIINKYWYLELCCVILTGTTRGQTSWKLAV